MDCLSVTYDNRSARAEFDREDGAVLLGPLFESRQEKEELMSVTDLAKAYPQYFRASGDSTMASDLRTS